jgi:uncharacterized protein YjbI with pentapeptide repeats
MKLSSPILPPLLSDGNDIDFCNDAEAMQFIDLDMSGLNQAAVDLDGVLLERVTLSQAQLPRLVAKDVVVRHGDLSAANMANGAVNRAEFASCRMTGIDFSKAQLHDVVFRGCKLGMANFRFSDIRRVKFVDCTLNEADFLGATLHDVWFESCELAQTVFDQAKCKNMDLRSSRLDAISGWGSLKGAIIDDVQLMVVAPYLAHQLGLMIKG